MMFKPKSKTKEPQNETKAYEYAVFLLSLQLRTEGEIREKMLARGYTPEIIDKVINQLLTQKYLDDERYAVVFLENLKQYKNLGYYGIKKKFMMKKLSNELIDRVLEEGFTIEEEIKVAKRLLAKEGIIAQPKDEEESRYQTYNAEASKAKQKTSQRLKSRGFRGEVIGKLVF